MKDQPQLIFFSDSAIQTAWEMGLWRDVEQTRYKTQYAPQPMPTAQPIALARPAVIPWNREILWPAICALDDASVRNLLLEATKTSLPIQQSILAQYTELKRTAQAQIVDFRSFLHDVGEIWDKYSSSSGSKEYENSGPATEEFQELISALGNTVTDEMSYGSKKNALMTLLAIGEEIVDAPSSCLGSEVRKDFQYDTSLAGSLCQITGEMTREEQRQIANDSEFVKGVKHLREGAKGYGFDLDLDQLLARLT